MRNLKITIVQADQFWEDKKANFSNYEKLLKDVKTDLIILPEMFQTGFSMNVDLLKEDALSSSSINWLKNFADKKNTAIYTSLIIQENKKTYNRGVFIKPNGEIDTYDKRKMFCMAGEDKFFTAGKKEKIVSYLGWNIQLQICYDLRFPEIVRNKLLSNKKPAYDIILYIANWPSKRSRHWSSLLNARAIENQCFVIGVNRVGVDEKKIVYSGDSQIISPEGVYEKVKNNKESVKTFVLEKEKLNSFRKKFPFLKDQ